RAFSQITKQEVEQYAASLGSSKAGTNASGLVKAFLTYAYKQGASKTNLASSFKLKKGTGKSVGSARPLQPATELTQEGYRKLRAELQELKDSRGAIAEELRRAAADKDFRENAPLEAAREHQGQVESRIRQLEALLGSAVVLSDERPEDEATKVALGCSVALRDLSHDEELTYVLVAPNEANLSEGKLSIESPVGKALLGRGKGEEIDVRVPAGTFRYRIERIDP
ncbi:MAG: GreA/GreB family elongation factor, partial [Dehalococcoidia bacterium]